MTSIGLVIYTVVSLYALKSKMILQKEKCAYTKLIWRKTAVTAHVLNKQLLLFVFVLTNNSNCFMLLPRHCPNAGLMMGHLLQQWLNTKPTLVRCFVFTGLLLRRQTAVTAYCCLPLLGNKVSCCAAELILMTRKWYFNHWKGTQRLSTKRRVLIGLWCMSYQHHVRGHINVVTLHL